MTQPAAYDRVHRARQVVIAREAGATFRQIGERYGVTGERARQLYHQGIRIRREDLAMSVERVGDPFEVIDLVGAGFRRWVLPLHAIVKACRQP